MSVSAWSQPLLYFPSVIYGEDQRQDLYEVADPELLRLADSTVALFRLPLAMPSPDWVPLNLHSYGESDHLCKSESFYDQKAGAICSGSLVGSDLVMTAGHCVDNYSCGTTRIVFGFAMKTRDADLEHAPADEVYQCRSIVSRNENPAGLDYALIRLDRPVKNHVPLKLDREKRVTNGTPLVLIGHPSGLPEKITAGGSVRNAYNRYWLTSERSYFLADIDSYAGNSGSPVFNAHNGLIVGILVRGEEDFVLRDPRDINSCLVSKRCDVGSCSGEEVVKTSFIQNMIPE